MNYLSMDLDTEMEGITNEIGAKVLSMAQSNVHVDSGALKSSLNMSARKEGDKFIVEIGSPLDYSTFEEYGTGGGVFIVSNGASYSFTNEDKAYASQFKRGGGRVIRTAHPYLSPAALRGYTEYMVKLSAMISAKVKAK